MEVLMVHISVAYVLIYLIQIIATRSKRALTKMEKRGLLLIGTALASAIVYHTAWGFLLHWFMLAGVTQFVYDTAVKRPNFPPVHMNPRGPVK